VHVCSRPIIPAGFIQTPLGEITGVGGEYAAGVLGAVPPAGPGAEPLIRVLRAKLSRS